MTNYQTAVRYLYQNFISDLEACLKEVPNPNAAVFVESKIQAALKDIAGLRTPAPIVAFQKSLIKLLVYEKNVAWPYKINNSLIFKTALVLQVETEKYNQAIQEYQREFQGVFNVGWVFARFCIQPGSKRRDGFINNVLGIKTAHAIFGLGDITFDPAVFLRNAR